MVPLPAGRSYQIYKVMKVLFYGNSATCFSSFPLQNESPQAFARAIFYNRFFVIMSPGWLTMAGSAQTDGFLEPYEARLYLGANGIPWCFKSDLHG